MITPEQFVLLQPATEVEVADALLVMKVGGRETEAHCLTIRRLAMERDSLRRRILQLTTAWIEYGYHTTGCDAFVEFDQECTCGYDSTRLELAVVGDDD